jgi:hypothetical protein
VGYKGPLGGPFVSHVIAFGCLRRLAGAKAAIVLALGHLLGCSESSPYGWNCSLSAVMAVRGPV